MPRLVSDSANGFPVAAPEDFLAFLRATAQSGPDVEKPTDVTYIPMARGFVYLVAVIDWFSRRALSWRIYNSMTADFCVEALEEAMGPVTTNVFGRELTCCI